MPVDLKRLFHLGLLPVMLLSSWSLSKMDSAERFVPVDVLSIPFATRLATVEVL